MRISRREVIVASGMAAAGLSVGVLSPSKLLARPQVPRQDQPDKLVQTPLRQIADLPLNPDGSAREYRPEEAGTISEPTLWRYTNNQTPTTEFDITRTKIKVDARGTANLSGTLTFSDLESLPHHSYVVALQCASPNPHGIVKWTGVKFSDFARKLGVQPFAYYCRIVGSDLYWVEEDMQTMMRPQVLLAWLLNDQPIPPKHGAPLRLIIPFRYGGRSLKAITEIYFSSNVFAMPKIPPPA